MPSAALRACAEPGCGALVPHGRCALHARAPWSSSTTVVRIRGRKLQRLRDRLFTQQPLCVLCQQAGRVTIATIRDHIVNLKAGGTDTEDNVQALCQACSDTKTHQESMRGRK